MIGRILGRIAPIFSKLNVTIWAVLAVLAAAAGPFGTYGTQGFWTLLVFWSLVIVVSAVMSFGVRWLADQLVGREQAIASAVLSCALMVVGFTPFLWVLIGTLVQNTTAERPAFWLLAVYVAIVTAAVIALFRVLPKSHQERDTTAMPVDPQPRLNRRLPPQFDGEIMRLTGRDHFVDIVTDRGTHTIRMRLSDAIDEMDTVAGYCTHRSHWVAQGAIAKVERNNGRVTLRLNNGDLIPVSRKYRAELEAGGVI